jgi:hypothetical protein
MIFFKIVAPYKKTEIYNYIKHLMFLAIIISVIHPVEASAQDEEISLEIKQQIVNSIEIKNKKIYKVLIHQEWVNLMIYIIADHSMTASTAKNLSSYAIKSAMEKVGEKIPKSGMKHGKYNYSAGVYSQDQKQVALAQKFRHIPKITW